MCLTPAKNMPHPTHKIMPRLLNAILPHAVFHHFTDSFPEVRQSPQKSCWPDRFPRERQQARHRPHGEAEATPNAAEEG
jgi:hypothetical protein